MKKIIKIVGISIVALIGFSILLAIFSTDTKKTNQKEKAETKNTIVENGNVLHTEYFDVSIEKVEIRDMVDTGNEYTNLPKEPGNRYLLMKVTFKNTSDESRMITNGTVWIDYNGKRYEFDNPETIMADGWGLLLDQINPLVTKTTKLAYKIPEEIKGDFYFQPGRSNDDELIYLGNVQ